MTGFGLAVGDLNGERFTVEVSGVNHRFLDCSCRLPFAWSAAEPRLRDLVKKHVSRGKLTLAVRRERNGGTRLPVQCDQQLAAQYLASAKELGGLLEGAEPLTLNTLMQLEGVFYQEEEQTDIDAVMSVLGPTVEEALSQFNRVREEEGDALAKDMEERISEMRDAVVQVESRIPEIVTAYEERLRQRIRDLNAEAGLKEDRLAVEVALMAEKADVNEELVRLKAHFEHAGQLLAAKEPIGRELNFLAQEIQREINTLGSKLRDVDVTREVLRMKTELEKLREQAQNIE
jgi:uncharacterized protein (TIGR00255 family)